MRTVPEIKHPEFCHFTGGRSIGHAKLSSSPKFELFVKERSQPKFDRDGVASRAAFCLTPPQLSRGWTAGVRVGSRGFASSGREESDCDHLIYELANACVRWTVPGDGVAGNGVR